MSLFESKLYTARFHWPSVIERSGACRAGKAGTEWLTASSLEFTLMQLSRFTDYAVRVLIYAAMFPDRRVTLHEMSDFYAISLAHLRKVVHKLSQLGYLKTYRGKHGGMQLQRAAADIRIGDVIGECEERHHLIDCVGLQCVVLPACGLPGMLKRAEQSFYQELQKYTLADVVIRERLPQVLEAAAKRNDLIFNGSGD